MQQVLMLTVRDGKVAGIVPLGLLTDELREKLVGTPHTEATNVLTQSHGWRLSTVLLPDPGVREIWLTRNVGKVEYTRPDDWIYFDSGGHAADDESELANRHW